MRVIRSTIICKNAFFRWGCDTCDGVVARVRFPSTGRIAVVLPRLTYSFAIPRFCFASHVRLMSQAALVLNSMPENTDLYPSRVAYTVQYARSKYNMQLENVTFGGEKTISQVRYCRCGLKNNLSKNRNTTNRYQVLLL